MKRGKIVGIICVILVISFSFALINYIYMQNKGLGGNEVLRLVTSNGRMGIGGNSVYYVLYEDGTLMAQWGTPRGEYSSYVIKDGEIIPRWGLLTKWGIIKNREYRDEDLKRTPYMKDIWKKEVVHLSENEYGKIIELANKVYEINLPQDLVMATDAIYYQILYKDKLTKQYYSDQSQEIKALAEEIIKFIPTGFDGLA